MQVRSPSDNKFISPYQKPAKLFSKLIGNHSRVGQWVLDCTAASGFTYISGTYYNRLSL